MGSASACLVVIERALIAKLLLLHHWLAVSIAVVSLSHRYPLADALEAIATLSASTDGNTSTASTKAPLTRVASLDDHILRAGWRSSITLIAVVAGVSTAKATASAKPFVATNSAHLLSTSLAHVHVGAERHTAAHGHEQPHHHASHWIAALAAVGVGRILRGCFVFGDDFVFLRGSVASDHWRMRDQDYSLVLADLQVAIVDG